LDSRATATRFGSLLALSLTLASLLPASSAAQSLGPDGTPFTSSNYSIDLTQGPVLAGTRVTGLAGAFAALAEGLEGGLTNPASVATRTAASADWWDYWVGLSITYPFDSGDFYNSGKYLSESGQGTSDRFLFLNTGAYLELLEFGFGWNIELTQVSVRTSTMEGAESEVRVNLTSHHVQAGYLFLDGQLALGGGLQILRESENAQVPGEPLKQLNAHVGFGGEIGALVRPNNAQWRVGAGLFSSVKTAYGSAEQDDSAEDGFILPEYAVRPWRGSVAGAYQLGRRPLNPRFDYVERRAAAQVREVDQRARLARAEHARHVAQLRAEAGPDGLARISEAERDFAEQRSMLEAERDAIRKTSWRELRAGVRRLWERRYVLFTAEVSFAGKVQNGVGLESFLAQSVQRSGERVTVTPRFAAESEVWPNHVKVRSGAYYEPTRFNATEGRLHGTLGFDVKLFRWDVFRIWPEDYLWQLSAAFDLSRDYKVFSAGIGGWY
jgi:hypothetical protein